MIDRDQLEIELKFRLASLRDGARLLENGVLGGLAPIGRTSIVRVEDRYVDTPGGALRSAGYAARLRTTSDGILVSVKSTARSVDGRVHRRRELEGSANEALSPLRWPPSDARALMLELCGDASLEELVTLRQLRRRRRFGDGRSIVELSADEIQVVSGGRIVHRFAELEAELVDGDPGVLAAVGQALAAAPGTSEAVSSKLEAALDAVGSPATRPGLDRGEGSTTAPDPPAPEVPAPERPAQAPAPERPADAQSGPPASAPEAPLGGPIEAAAESPTPRAPRSRARATPEPSSPGVRGDHTVAEAGRRVLAFHLARMLAREPGTRAGDVEELHQMRVATRRMRAAWRVFGEGFDPARTRRHRVRLRRVARRLGAVRDLDVLLEGIEAYRADLPATDQHGLDPLVAALGRRRELERRALLRELDGAPYRRWTDAFLAFVQAEGEAARRPEPTEPQRIRDTAPAAIWSAFARVRAYEPVLRWADVPTLHKLRISAKWLRYTLEFHREALGAEAGGVIGRVTRLQDHLGLLHDADVAASLARAFLAEHATTVADAERAAIARFLADRERLVAEVQRGAGSAWRSVAGLTFRRRLGRLVAGL